MTSPADPSLSGTGKPAAAKKNKPRPLWFHLHFWIGWIAAIPIILVCLTGGILTFDKYLHRLEYPEQFRLTPTDQPLDLDGIMEVIAKAEPKLVLFHLGFPKSPTEAYSGYVQIINEDGTRKGGSIIINPYTGELTHKASKFTFSGLAIDLHRHLAAGKIGQQIVAISSVLLAVTGIFGLVLWWPMRGRTFVRAWKRGNALDWHNALGLVALVPLIIMALTGILFTWGNKIWPVMEKMQPTAVKVQDPVAEVPENGKKIPLSIPLANLRENFPDGEVTGVQPTGGPSRPYVFFVSQDGLEYRVCMNPYTGEEMSRFDQKQPGPVAWLRKNFGKLHTGNFHPVMAYSWSILSVVGGVLGITGLWISVKRWRRRARA